MSELGDLATTRETLRDVARIVKFTRQTLANVAQEQRLTGRPVSHRPGQLSDTLQHLGEVREGFIISQRTSDHVTLSELRALVQQVLVEWDWLESLNLTALPADQVESPQQQLVAFNHAFIALAVLPRLPASVITFPQKRPSYADVPTPALPHELLNRLDEIERVIYQAEAMPNKSLEYNSFRRTYAFFEAGAWLVNNYLDPLLKD
ncbi:MAG: hypothetical protein U0401_14485 [Anaerolineae bacterium]